MTPESLPPEAARQINPRALIGYAKGLGWLPATNGRRRDLTVFHQPDARLRQIIIPTDHSLADYGEAVAEAVRKLAEFETIPAREVLEHLLLPPADVLRFRETGPDAEFGSLPFEHAVRMIIGTRRLLLSAAHSALSPQSYYPRLSFRDAEEFVDRCRLGQTERGSFVLSVACPLEQQPMLPDLGVESFARRVTSLLIDTLGALAAAADHGDAGDLLDPERHPGISANLCESLLMLRPNGDQAGLTVSASWSRAMLPNPRERVRQVRLPQHAFELAQAVAPRLRTTATPRDTLFLGFVDVLSGQPTREDIRPSGDVDFTLLTEDDGEIKARGRLNADDYAIAAEAHLASKPVRFKATLLRKPRLSRVDAIEEFGLIAAAD